MDIIGKLGDRHWDSLISETQLATDQCVDGLRDLARVNLADQFLFEEATSEVRYILHRGLTSYTAGLERLAKLTLLCAQYGLDSGFPNTRTFGHRIGKLLSSVAHIDINAFSTSRDTSTYPNRNAPADYPVRIDSELISILETFAQGSGRYEYLDSLSKPDITPGLYKRWSLLAEECVVSESVEIAVSIGPRVINALYLLSRIAGEAGLDSGDYLVEPFIDNIIDDGMSGKAIELSLECFRIAKYVASRLSLVTEYDFYHSKTAGFPLLREIVGPKLGVTDDYFLQLSILQLNDIDCTLEALSEIENLEPL